MAKTVSIIIPVFNERETILKILEKVREVALPKQIIVVDDGSTDGTKEILTTLLNEEDLEIFFHPRNMGKGTAIRTAIPHVTSEFLIIQDADLEYDPQDYDKLLAPLKKGTCNIVYGTREGMAGNTHSHLTFFLGGKFLTWLTNRLFGSHLTDMPTCYKAFNTNCFKSFALSCKGFDFCPEITAKVLKKGHAIMEVPIHYYPRKIKDGKKIRFADGLQAILTLLRIRFFER